MKNPAKTHPSRVHHALTALVAACALGNAASAQTIDNPSFEADTYNDYPGYSSQGGNGPINGWTTTTPGSVGLNPTPGGSPFADNGTIPHGAQVAFLQSVGANLSTTITGLTPGVTYKVSFRANARGGNLPIVQFSSDGIGDTVASRIPAVGGGNPYFRLAYNFTATAASNVITVTNLQAPDNTLVVDDFSIAPSTSWSFSPWTDDASSGVEQGYCYTHAYTLGGSCVSTVVNGVGFLATGGGDPAVAGKFSISGLPNGFGDQGRNISGASNNLGKSFIYGGPNMSVTLNNLKPFTSYVATVYGVNFDGNGGDRTSIFSSSLNPTDVLTVNVDQYGANNGIRVNYAYTTDATGSVNINYQQTFDASWHTTAFSNREAAPESSWTRSPWTNDATSGVDGTATYTHAYNFGSGSSPTINGISFTGIGGGNPSAGNFSTSGFGGVFPGDSNALTGNGDGSAAMAADFVYGGNPTIFNLTGLTPGASYNLTLFSVGWEPNNGARVQTFSGDTGSLVDDQDAFGDNNGCRFDYRYVADAAGNATIRVKPVSSAGATLHCYGFCNRLLPAITPGVNAWKRYAWNDDATSGIDGAATYSHAYNFGSGDSPTVNGIPFTGVGGPNPSASNFSLNGPNGVFPGDSNNVTGTSATLAKDFVYNGNPATLNLSGLNPGEAYRLTIFTVGWEPAGRWQTFSGSNGALVDDQDSYGDNNGTRFEYEYIADSAGRATVTAYPSGGTLHIYAFANRSIAPLADTPAWVYSAWNGDASSGLTTAGIYTHAFNLNSGSNLVINGVGVTGIPGANPSAGNFTTANFNAPFSGFGNNVADAGSSNAMATDFVYNGYPGGLNLSGLTPGKEYILSLYLVGFGGPGSRVVKLSGPSDCILLDEGGYGSGNGMRADYRYVANSAGTVNITTSPQGSGSLHLHGFANRNAELLPISAPNITLEPQGGAQGTGRSFTFTVGATGTPTLTYQWKFNGDDIPSANGPTYTVTNLTHANTGNYSVVVTNFFGDDTSADALLTVYDSINGLFDTGVSQNCLLQADGTSDPHYQLIVNADGGAAIPAVVHDATIFPIVTGPWIANTATSKWISPRANSAGAGGIWLVLPDPLADPPVVGVPNDQGAGAGTYVYRTTIDLTGYDPSSVVIAGSWTSDNDGPAIRVNGVDTGITASGNFGTLNSFTLSSVNSTFTTGVNTIDFLVSNQDALGGYTGLRVADLHGFGTLPNNTPPHIAVQPSNTTVARNASFCLAVAANGSPNLTYQWYKDDVLLPGEIAPTLTATADNFTVAGTYKVVVTNGSGNTTSNNAVVTIPNQVPVANPDCFATTKDTLGSIEIPTVLGNDSDGDLDPLTITVSDTSAQGGAVEVIDPTVYYLPPSGFTGTDTISYTIDDGWGGVTSGTIEVRVLPDHVPACGEIILDSEHPQSFTVGVIPGQTYLFERSVDLQNWDPVNTYAGPATGVLDAVDPDPLVELRFYRFKEITVMTAP